MNAYTLSEGAQAILAGAREDAVRLGQDAVGAEHVLVSLLERGQLAPDAFRAVGLDPTAATERLRAAGGRGKRRPPAEPAGETIGGAESGEVGYTSYARRLIEIATKEARERQSSIGEVHLLLAALHEPRGPIAKLFPEGGPGADAVRGEVLRALGGPVPAPERPKREPRQEPKPRAERPPRGERGERGERAPRAEAPARPERKEQVEKERVERPERPERTPSIGRLAPPPKRGLSWRLALLAAVPASIALSYGHASPVLVFVASCLGVLPLAAYMGEATEHLAQRTGPTIGGLLNATFGNAAELIIAIVALRAGYVELVKASITGSILGNLLLIMGLSILAGSAKQGTVRFSRTAAGTSAGMLALAVVGLVFPALFHATHPERAARVTELQLSEWVAVVLIVTYACSLWFSLRTHHTLFGGEPHPTAGPTWSVTRAVAVLAMATVGVAIESELLVHSTEAVTRALGLSEVFLGLVVIPIIGNAAEHAAAVVVARKGKMDLALQIALGSSTQIALLVAPVLVFVGLMFGRGMDLVFRPFEVIALGLATIVNAVLMLDGESHWFEGIQLLAVYAMVAAAAFFI